MKKVFQIGFILLCCFGCEPAEEQKTIEIPLEISFEDSKYRLQLGATSEIGFEVSGIDGAQVEATAAIKNPEWSASCTLDPESGKGKLSVVTPAKLGVTTVKVTVSDAAGKREAEATIALASTSAGMPELEVAFEEETASVEADGDPVTLHFKVNNVLTATVETPTEADVTTSLNVTDLSWDAATATGTVTIFAPESAKSGSVPLSIRVKDNYMRETTGTIMLTVIGLVQKPSFNCYIVKPEQTLKFDRKYNSITSVELAWQDAPNAISSFSVSGHNVSVTAGTASGNALLLGKDESGNTKWSWHIWVTDFDPEATAVTVNGVTFMDRNLGAINATVGDIGAIGQGYQWGRKDPFPRPLSKVTSGNASIKLYDASGAEIPDLVNSNGEYFKMISSSNVNVETTIANAEYFFYRNSSNMSWWSSLDAAVYKELWGGVSGVKSEYDPCPEGWKVPVVTSGASGAVNPYQFILEDAAVLDTDNCGLLYDNKLWFPVTGERARTKGVPSRTGLEGNYWIGSFDKLDGTKILFNYAQFSPNASKKQIEGQARPVYGSVAVAVRCVKE